MLADMQNRSDQTDSRAAVEDIGHLTQKICTIWGTPELDAFLSALLMDARDGARKGLRQGRGCGGGARRPRVPLHGQQQLARG